MPTRAAAQLKCRLLYLHGIFKRSRAFIGPAEFAVMTKECVRGALLTCVCVLVVVIEPCGYPLRYLLVEFSALNILTGRNAFSLYAFPSLT